MLNMKAVTRVNPEFSSKEKFCVSLILYLYEMMFTKLTVNYFMMCVSQIFILYTLNLYSAVCQYLNQTGRKNNVKGRNL